jgi:hypothetical protein
VEEGYEIGLVHPGTARRAALKTVCVCISRYKFRSEIFKRGLALLQSRLTKALYNILSSKVE